MKTRTPFFRNLAASAEPACGCRFLFQLFLFVLLTCKLSPAATITSQPGGGNWSTPATWVSGVVPAPTDDVVIAAANATPVICDVNAACAQLTINASCQLNLSNDVTLTATGAAIYNTTLGVISTGTGNSKLLLAGSGNQVLSSGGTYGNLEISNLVGFVQTPLITSVGMPIATNCTLTVDSGAFLQQGNMVRAITGGGNFVLAAGATLAIKDASGITSSSSDTNGFIRVYGTRSFSAGANYIYNGTLAQLTGAGLPATINSLSISNTAGVTLSGNVTVSGATTIRAGTLAMSATALLTAGSSLNIMPGATLDVSGLGTASTYTLGGGATLIASGTGTTNGVNAAVINGGASGTINLGSQPINLTYDGLHPALYISQGTLSLNGNVFKVNSAAPLAQGTYPIIQQASGSVVSNGMFTVSGTAIGPGTSGAIQVNGTNVNLLVTPLQLAITSINGGVTPIAGTGFSVVVQAQGAGGTLINVVTDTTVILSRTSGTGTLGGTLTGTILAGNNSVTISGVTYTKAESGVVLTATRTTGDSLMAGNSATFPVNAGAPATLVLTSGNNQSGLAKAPLLNPFVVTITDANGNLASGASVTFAVATVPLSATGQALSVTSTTSAANGQASSTLTLGNSPGTYTVTVSFIGLSGSPVTFYASATGNLAVTSINGGVTPTAGTGFSVVVQAQGAGGVPINVVTDTTITLSRATGTGSLGGTLTGTILAGNNSVTISGVTYTKSETGVVLTVTRNSGDTLTAGSSAAFTVGAGAAATLTLTSGNGQIGVAGAALASPLVVTVTDANGNPVTGTNVIFAVTTVPGGATGQSLSITNAITIGSGQASSTLTLGSLTGTYVVTATAAGLSSSPVTFTATATAKLAITSVNGGVNPAAGSGFSVVVQAQGTGGTPVNVLTDTTVTLTRATGTGTLGGTLTVTIPAGNNSVTISGVTYTKAESGVVLTATRTAGDSLVAGNSAAFTVTAGAAKTLTLTSGNSQSGKRSAALASPFVVTATDANGNLVNGASVTFSIATVPGGATGQALSVTSTTTAANGQASSTLTLGNTAGTYTITATSAGLSGSPVTFTATATAGSYTVLTAVTNEYQICFKCHSGYAWLPAAPPAGNSPNGSAANPVMTDVAQEFSPMNKSGHPITTGLNNYVNSIAPKALAAAALKAPWNVNMGTQTMMCSDCHDATTTNYIAAAAQGPHGSANQFILRGPNAANWPNVTTFSTSWCANCHKDNVSMDGHANHHSSGGCNTCHIVIPHGGKLSRLIADEDGTMPARYALNSSISTTTVKMTSFTKSTSASYGESACRTDCGHHSSGSSTSMENW